MAKVEAVPSHVCEIAMDKLKPLPISAHVLFLHSVPGFCCPKSITYRPAHYVLWNEQSQHHPLELFLGVQDFPPQSFALLGNPLRREGLLIREDGSLSRDIQVLDVPRAEDDDGETVPKYGERTACVRAGDEVRVLRWERTVWGEFQGQGRGHEEEEGRHEAARQRRSRAGHGEGHEVYLVGMVVIETCLDRTPILETAFEETVVAVGSRGVLFRECCGWCGVSFVRAGRLVQLSTNARGTTQPSKILEHDLRTYRNDRNS